MMSRDKSIRSRNLDYTSLISSRRDSLKLPRKTDILRLLKSRSSLLLFAHKKRANEKHTKLYRAWILFSVSGKNVNRSGGEKREKVSKMQIYHHRKIVYLFEFVFARRSKNKSSLSLGNENSRKERRLFWGTNRNANDKHGDI